ncbi:MAG TPA: hypothetical protein VF995_04755 [Actinomycetota bacterium]
MSSPDRLEAWAAANPAARDALLEVTEQAVTLQPAAEVVIQLAHDDQHRAQPEWEVEQRRVEDAYRVLQARLRSLEAGGEGGQEVAKPVGALLEHHAALVAGARAAPADGLGRVAGELVAFRDRLRRTVPVRGREVADLQVDKLL